MVLKRQDIILILLFLIAALILIFTFNVSKPSGIAVVEENGSEVYRFNLAEQKETEEINIGGKYNVKLKLEPGAISFIHSDCPDQICVRTGKISKPGQVAVCLPAKISIKIISSKKLVDGYTG